MFRGQSSVTNALPHPTSSPPPPPPLVEPTLALVLWVLPHASSVDINGPCQVNNSRWDVLEPDDLEQFGLQEREEDNGGNLNMNTELMDCKVVDGSEKKKPVIPKRKRSNRKNKKIAAEGWKWKEFVPGNTNYCNETNANGLLCGKPTNYENTLCDFHVEQLILPTNRNRKYEDLDLLDFCATDPKSAYYYYNEFRPRKSKRRTCAIEDTVVKAVEEQMEEPKVEEQTESVFVVPIFDDLSVGESTGDGMEEGTKRKRGRKATKPRSL